MNHLIILISLIILTIANIAYAQNVWCTNAWECIGDTISISAYANINGDGYKSIFGPTTSIDIDFESTGTIYCSGAFACSDISFINTPLSIYCSGSNSCSNINGSQYINLASTSFSTGIICDGSNSCQYSNLRGNKQENYYIGCYGDRSCNYAYFEGITEIDGYGAYSLHGAVFNSSGLANNPIIHFRGYYSGFGATIICYPETTCTINCDGNGCYMLYTQCLGTNNCIINKASNNTIEPITNPNDYNESLLNTFYDSEILTISSNKVCGGTNKRLDDWREQQNSASIITHSFAICCRGLEACSNVNKMEVDDPPSDSNMVVCSAKNSCESSNIYAVNGSVYCDGSQSCSSTNIITNHDLYCFGSKSCKFSNISNAQNVICAGYTACYGATIRSSGDMNIYLLTENWSGPTQIYCNENDSCLIFCGSYRSCLNTIVYCNGFCTIECIDGATCPVIISAAPTTPPSSSPVLQPTFTPSISPTTPPTHSPSQAPVVTPSFAPTQPPSIAPSLNPIQYPSVSPSNIPTYSPTNNPTTNPTHKPTSIPTSSPFTTTETLESLSTTNDEGSKSDDNSNSNDNIGVTIGVIIGVLVLIIVIVVVYWQYFKKKKHEVKLEKLNYKATELMNKKPQCYTPLARYTQNQQDIIKIRVQTDNQREPPEWQHDFIVNALYSKDETIDNILTATTEQFSKMHNGASIRINSAKGFLGSFGWRNNGPKIYTIKSKSITEYVDIDDKTQKRLCDVTISIHYEHTVTNQQITCKHMIRENTINPLKCPIYAVMKQMRDPEFTKNNLKHIIQFQHFKNEFEEKPICALRDKCRSYIRLEKGYGSNPLNDICHMVLYKHPPRNRTIEMSKNVSAFIVDEAKYQYNMNKKINTLQDPNLIHCFEIPSKIQELYEPTDIDNENYKYNDKDGYLIPLIQEVISNGYKYDLCIECGSNDECKHNNYSILQIVDEKLKHHRHKAVGSPLTRAQMLALVLYTGCDCNYDLCAAQRKYDYAKWKWFDLCLYKGITRLGRYEWGDFTVYSGLHNIKMKQRELQDSRFVTYVSTSWRKDVAMNFMNGNGMIIQIDPKLKCNDCCDVSWISKFPDECEILFSRNAGCHGFKKFDCVVVDQSSGVQSVLFKEAISIFNR